MSAGVLAWCGLERRALLAEVPRSTLGIQLYTVAADLERDVPGTLAALRSIGYENLESAGFAKLSAKDFLRALDRSGLKCRSCHLSFSNGDPEALFADAQAVGAKYVVSSTLFADLRFAMPSSPTTSTSSSFNTTLNSLTLEDYMRVAERANQIAAKASRHGLQYAYHNHNFEFRNLGKGKTGYDVLLEKTDPTLVKFELDCGWMITAGRNPVEYMGRYPKRYSMLHIKDFRAGTKTTTDLLGPNRPTGTELGRGHIDYKSIFAAGVSAGIEYFLSEQEPPIVDMTPLEAAKVNYVYMHSL